MISTKQFTAAVGKTLLILALSAFFSPPTAFAGGYPWRDHAPPYDFKFGNHIDTHQQSRIRSNGSLFGFLYITPVEGEEVIDGIPVMEHCDENTTADECRVGWIMRGILIGESTPPPIFVYQAEKDHPTWLMNSRNDIPVPGAFVHFHWLGDPPGGGGFEAGNSREGYLIELRAVKTFYFRHNDEDLLVRPGIDTSTHVNIVGSYPGY